MSTERVESGNRVEWRFTSGITVIEDRTDGTLEVRNECRTLGYIVPGDSDGMTECERRLDAGEDPISGGWEDGIGNRTSINGWGQDGPYSVYFRQGDDHMVHIELVPQSDESDIWGDLSSYDQDHGTRYSEMLGTDDILGTGYGPGDSQDAYAGRAGWADDGLAKNPRSRSCSEWLQIFAAADLGAMSEDYQVGHDPDGWRYEVHYKNMDSEEYDPNSDEFWLRHIDYFVSTDAEGNELGGRVYKE